MSDAEAVTSRLYNWREMLYGFFPNKPSLTENDYPDLTDKTAIVTGSNTGIGYEVVKLLYKKNCNVIMVVRTESKGIIASNMIKQELPESKGSLSVVGGCDFDDLSVIKGAAQEIKELLKDKPLNIIIHNAGIMPPNNDDTSKQGNELIFQTNVMGPQLLQHFLDPLFLKKDSDLKRIVWVSSAAHFLGPADYGIFWENPTFKGVPVTERPHSMTLYGQSKAANVYQASAWAKANQDIVEELGCISTSCYPGNLKSDLTRKYNSIYRKLVLWMLFDVKYGAYSELYSVLSPDVTMKDQGKYVVPFGEFHDPRGDIKLGLTNGKDKQLWDLVEEKISSYL